MKEKTINNFINAFILLGMVVAVVILSVFKLQRADGGEAMLIVAAFGTVAGVLNTVLSANGSIWSFLFGLLDVSIYAFALFKSGVYGTAALHVLYFLPMQFVGFFQWRRRGATGETKVKARRLEGAMRIKAVAGCAGVILVAMSVLLLTKKGSLALSGLDVGIVTDAAVVGFNIVGQILLSLAFRDQWYAWILVNVFSIVLWSDRVLNSGDIYAAVYLIKYIFYLLNSLNGLRIWNKLSD